MRRVRRLPRTIWLALGLLISAGLTLAQVRAQSAAKITVAKDPSNPKASCSSAFYTIKQTKKELCKTAQIDLGLYELSTTEGGRAPLVFPNKTKVTLFSKSKFQINSYSDKGGLKGKLLSGTIQYASTKKKGSDTIEGNKTKLVHIGTTFVFSVGTAPAPKAHSQRAKASLTWKRAELKKFKASDVSRWRTLVPELCSNTCGADSWKKGEVKGEISFSNFKLKSSLECGCAVASSDRDNDAIPDSQDSCPKQAGPEDPYPPLNGCPVMVERVVLLPDADGRVGTVQIQEKRTGTVLAKLDKPYTSAGVTTDGAVVQPEKPEEPAAVALPEAAPTAPPSPEPAPAPSVIATPGAVLCRETGFGGHCEAVPTQPNLMTTDVGNDTVSSFRLGTCDAVKVCSDIEFGGMCQTFRNDQPDLSVTRVGNQHASSIQCIEGTVDPTSGAGALLCRDAGFGGYCEAVATQPNLMSTEVGNDSVSSLRLGTCSAVKVCSDIAFGGECETFRTDQPYLAGTRVGDERASSIECISSAASPASL